MSMVLVVGAICGLVVLVGTVAAAIVLYTRHRA